MKKLLLLLVAGIVVAAGCSDQRNVTLKSADNTGVITGKVIDFSTRSPIANATVILTTGGNNMVTKTISDSNPNPNLNRTGIFVFNGVPAGDYKLKIVATGYATVETENSLYYNDYTNTNNTVVYDFGEIPIYKGFNLDVYVDSNGTMLPGVTVYTANNGVSSGCQFIVQNGSYFYSPEITATTDGSGHAILQGLSECNRYLIVAPAIDVNGDGIYDYQTAAVTYYGPTRSNTALNLNMAPAQRYDGISLIASSADNFMNLMNTGYFDIWNGGVYNAVAPQGDMVFVFNYPVAAENITMVNWDTYVINTDPNYFVDVNTPITATLSAGNTVLTIHPVANLVINNTYWLGGNVSANINGALQVVSLNNLYDPITGNASLQKWYVFDNTAAGVGGASFTITADNFNGTVNGGGGFTDVYLKFPEWVSGTWQVIGYTSGGASTYSGAFGPTGNFINGYVWYEGNGAGACDGTTCPGTKVVFIYDITANAGIPTFQDDTSFGGPSANSVTVAIDASDAEGNHFSGIMTLPVN